MTINELRKAAGMTQTQFANYFGIPYRTVQKWDLGTRQCADYLLRLMEYKLRNEGIIK
jgi:DNA-binding transcriptional regulator YiaG